MGNPLTLPGNYEEICNNISNMISTARKGVYHVAAVDLAIKNMMKINWHKYFSELNI